MLTHGTRAGGSDTRRPALDDIVITARLSERTGRTVDHRAEVHALLELGRQIASDPQGVLDRLERRRIKDQLGYDDISDLDF